MLLPDTIRSLSVAAEIVNYDDGLGEGTVSKTWIDSLIKRYKMSYRGPRDEEVRRAVFELESSFRPLYGMKDRRLAEWANETVKSLRIYPKIVTHGGLGWHVHYFEDETPLVDRIKGSTAMATMDVIQQGEARRLRCCAAENCGNVFLDTTRNFSKIFCDPAGCGNRVNGMRFRERSRALQRSTPVA